MQVPEGDFLKGLLPDVLKQLGAGGSSLPQQIIKMGMQGTTFCVMRLHDAQGPSQSSRTKGYTADAIGLLERLPRPSPGNGLPLLAYIWEVCMTYVHGRDSGFNTVVACRLLSAPQELGYGSWAGVQGGHGRS